MAVKTQSVSLLSNRGVTLLELAVSLAVMFILLGAFGLPWARSFVKSWKSREAADLVMLSLRQAKWLAITENKEYAVRFAQVSENGPWCSQLLRRVESGWQSCQEPQTFPPAVLSLATTGPATKEFNPDGTCSSGSVVLRCHSGRIYRFTLTPATGGITLRRL